MFNLCRNILLLVKISSSNAQIGKTTMLQAVLLVMGKYNHMRGDEHTFQKCSCLYAEKEYKQSYLGHSSYCKHPKESILITATHKGPGFNHGMSWSQ